LGRGERGELDGDSVAGLGGLDPGVRVPGRPARGRGVDSGDGCAGGGERQRERGDPAGRQSDLLVDSGEPVAGPPREASTPSEGRCIPRTPSLEWVPLSEATE